ncbi:MAG: hypothetical protein JRE45_01370 [Deltaproteobacteria bacterium]|nr:hypothetical protein [Deltaproteobacteria bacterium]MBW1874830.1 hypothetical protein [Deltaproteobacteria bacterium]MBW2626243.1 hypothetical protein [Deltaproteobacteria bacterium]MBW2685977.1 hypothetical protein [Deltaproteobacteria bacterium]
MRYFVGFACVVVVLVASPLSASAQAGEEGTAAEPSAEQSVQSTQPTRSRLERWHPEAFVDPALQLGVDSAGLEVTPTGPLTAEELQRQEEEAAARKRRVGIGVGVSVALVLAALLAGFVVAVGSM